MLYVESPNTVPADAPRPIIFMAGTITGSEDWQSKVRESLENEECTLVNPRRAEFDVGDKNAGVEQIRWEAENLWNTADMFTMWMTDDTVGPICLYELGFAMGMLKSSIDNGLTPPFAAVVVGCDPDYARRFDVVRQSEFIFGKPVEPHATLEEHVEHIREAIALFRHCAETETYDDAEYYEEDYVCEPDAEPDESDD